jgi:hypothetical protein
MSTPREFGRKLMAMTASTPAVLLQTLVSEAETIMTASKEQYVPVDTGALRASGFVEPPIPTAMGASITLGFGGPSAPYAVIVHEDLTKRHRVGQAKYLEIPFRARVQGMEAVLAMRTRDAIRQSFQRLAKVEANVIAGRALNWGMPLFG